MSQMSDKNYLDPKTLDRIKKLDMRARLVVNGYLTGQHQSPYHGFAVEFAAHREYAPGDDIRHIDWKVWSKTDRFYIKEYEEETNLKCTILLDCSKSMRYGEETGWSKFDYGATAAASLTYLLQQQQDAVGMVAFSERIEKMLKASANPNHLKLMLHEMQQLQPSSKTDVGNIFLELAAQIPTRGLIVLISDLFLDLEQLKKALQQFRMRQHEVIVFHLMHHDELTFPFEENTLFKGMEEEVQLYTEPRALRKAYLESLEKFQKEVKRICAGAAADLVSIDTSTPLDAVLTSYLSFRQRTRRKLLRR